MMNLHDMLSSGMVGASSYGDAYLYQVQPDESLSEIAARYGVSPEDIVLANPDKPRVRSPYGWTFADIGFGEPLWLPPWITIPMGIGSAESHHSFGVGVIGRCGDQLAEFHPDAWDWDKGTYTIQSGDDPIGIVNLYLLCKDPSHPIHELNAVNGNQVTDNTGHTNATFWQADKVINMPAAALITAKTFTCPDATYEKRADGACVKKGTGGGTKPGLQQAGMFGSLGLLLLVGLGVGLLAMATGKKSGGGSHVTPAHHRLTSGHARHLSRSRGR
jgi:hypothetical protein